MTKFSTFIKFVMIPESRVVSATKVSSDHGLTTGWHFTEPRDIKSLSFKIVSYLDYKLNVFFREIMNCQRRVLETMFRLRNEFQIINVIISFVLVFMVNDFFRKRLKFAPQVLFHYISVLKDSSPINVNSYISTICNSWHVPVLQFKSFIPLPPSFMDNATVYGFSANRWSIAPINIARRVDFSTLHILSLQQTGLYV